MPTIREQLAINLRHALLRRGADETYADADDASWAAVDWTRLQHSMKVGGEHVNVLDTGGDGSALLWVHGLSANWQSWLLNLPQFMGTYRCVALDLPGFGASDLPADEITITDYARTLDRVCDALGIRSVSVVGHSMGGFIGDGARVAVPDASRAVGAGLRRRALAGERAARAACSPVGRMLATGAAHAAAYQDTLVRRPRLRRLALQGVVRYPERLSPALTAELFSGAGKPGFMPALEALMSYSFRDRLCQIEVPVLVVWGEYDLLVPVAGRGRVRSASSGQRAQARLRGHGARAADRAADAVQRAAGGVPRRRAIPCGRSASARGPASPALAGAARLTAGQANRSSSSEPRGELRP